MKVKHVASDARGINLYVGVTLDADPTDGSSRERVVQMSRTALLDRIRLYELAADPSKPTKAEMRAVVHAILREHHERLTRPADWEPPQGASKRDVLGGLRKGVTIDMPAGALAALDTAVEILMP